MFSFVQVAGSSWNFLKTKVADNRKVRELLVPKNKTKRVECSKPGK